MNYRKTPETRPWAKQLDRGDLLTEKQALCVDATRLRDFGLAIQDNQVVKAEMEEPERLRTVLS